MPPLPSSLASLPEESLPGFLLRLAYRLGLSPSRIAAHCGLAGRLQHGQVQVDQLIDLPAETCARLSYITRLTPAEVTDLGLLRFAERYPAVARHRHPADGRTSHSGAVKSSYADTWAANFSSRYCPDCLFEAGRKPEGAFGGSWKLRWHLPIIFACTRHARLLEHLCPACATPVTGPAGQRVTLIARSSLMGLHPHQCRNYADTDNPLNKRGRHRPSCAARYDEPAQTARGHLPAEDLDRVLALQTQIEQHLGLSPQDAAGQDTDETYLTDLISTARLLKLSWPNGATLSGSDALAALIDQHIAPISAALAPRYTPDKARSRRATLLINLWGAPLSPGECAALLLAADSVLSDRDPTQFRNRLQPLARAAAKQHPATFRTFRQQEFSPTFKRALAPRIHAFNDAAVHPRILPATHDCLFTADEVPPHLPQDWYDDYLTHFASCVPSPNLWTPRHLRRITPIKLVEMTAGGTWKQCAARLGIPVSAAKTSLSVLRQQIAATGLWEEFEDIVEQLAHQLSQARRRTDYARRRRALENWEIPLDHWQTMCSDVYRADPYIGHKDPAIGTVLTWAMVNQAEHLHSPTLIKMRAQSKGASRALNNKIALFQTPRHRTGSHLVIHNRIDIYAKALAKRCDKDDGPGIDLKELLPWEPEIPTRTRRRRL